MPRQKVYVEYTCNWNRTVTAYLRQQGLKASRVDPCIFMNHARDLFQAIYVDDGLTIGRQTDDIDRLMTGLRKCFEMSVVDNPSSYVGYEMERTSQGLYLHQTSYVKKVVEKFHMRAAAVKRTPLTKPTENPKPFSSHFPYREAVGSLLYVATKTRPDVAYAVNYESRFMEDPSVQDVINIKRTIRYLASTMYFSLFFRRDAELILNAYCDSDYAGCEITRKSTTGYVICLDKSPLCWTSRRQEIMTVSSGEAEYVAAAECCKELVYVKALLEELTGHTILANLHIDNASAIGLIVSGQRNRRSNISTSDIAI